MKGRDGSDEMLGWSEMQMMKYTWRVAQEVMRLTPPGFGNFKRAWRDTSFGGFDIPKGWQMASLNIRCGGKHISIQNQNLCSGIDRSIPDFSPNRIAQFRSSLSISNHIDSTKRKPLRISASTTTTTTISNSPICPPCFANVEPYCKILNQEHKEIGSNEPLFSEKLDEWMRDSVVEIVQNLREAPLLVQVYANKNGDTRLETKKAIAENWPNVKRNWKVGETPSPDGVILVEELEDEKDLNADAEENGAKAWGIVIQGKGLECAPAFYLLKTSSVGSDLGRLCTHFSAVRVKSFSESALSQLTDCWLLQ
ncbi:hypothetical protein F0562_031493 [Nyssa sinensis]|uniref:DUF7804 domain-containing protein n=1 Tax=Nyssa sinensis TaxID=561372 RepID=A0A5J5AVT1_9ASTE|nr:hypothetical protein F0562_031493 [Nyssa sinensis]